MENINYRVILDECMKGLRDPAIIDPMMKTPARSYIAEYRTITIQTPRQTGSSKFLADLVNDGQAIAICMNATQMKQFLRFVKPEMADRVIINYQANVSGEFYKFKNEGIKIICLDDSNFINLKREVYNELIDTFGEDLVILKS